MLPLKLALAPLLLAQRLGRQVFPDKRRAIATIVPRLDPAVCARCQVRLFEECSQRPGAALSHEI